MTAYLVRHAKAGSREEWEGDDRLRPLTSSGRRQAQALVDVLKDRPIDEVRSSSYLRCMQTVEPLAQARRLRVVTDKALEEGAGMDGITRVMEHAGDRSVVLCTHGDVVEEVLQQLVREGFVKRDRANLEKGSTWVLDHAEGRITGAHYLAAP
jgi:8-oxo-dGTP diphosphatase